MELGRKEKHIKHTKHIKHVRHMRTGSEIFGKNSETHGTRQKQGVKYFLRKKIQNTN